MTRRAFCPVEVEHASAMLRRKTPPRTTSEPIRGRFVDPNPEAKDRNPALERWRVGGDRTQPRQAHDTVPHPSKDKRARPRGRPASQGATSRRRAARQTPPEDLVRQRQDIQLDSRPNMVHDTKKFCSSTSHTYTCGANFPTGAHRRADCETSSVSRCILPMRRSGDPPAGGRPPISGCPMQHPRNRSAAKPLYL